MSDSDVIDLFEFKRRHTTIRFNGEHCRERGPHIGPFEIDESLEKVKCKACDQMLSPIFVLKIFHDKMAAYKGRLAKLEQLENELIKKSRCKCDHCGRFTKIKVRDDLRII